VLLVAPFARGAAHGGSLRATAMAERLEDRGAEVTWRAVPVEHGGRATKIMGLLRGRPALVRAHTASLPAGDGGEWDLVIGSHSYLAPALDGVDRGLIDFHNLEWAVLEGTARAEGGAHGAYLRVQAQLMRRFERALLRGDTPVALASAEEAAWARAQGATRAVVVPNVLPRAAVAEAERAAALRAAAAGGAGAPLLYVGTLTFPPNVIALLGFLRQSWPAIRAADPAAELLVAGRCAPEVAAALARHPGVRALGFVEDLPALLAHAVAAVLPFDGRGGSSLRCLQNALARIPVVASPAAARGLPFSPGLTAADPRAWAAAVAAVRAGAADVAAAVDAAERGARALQQDEAPWDALWALAGPTERTRRATQELAA
jgi:hypothetical protein